jgi:DNA replication protein DnaC
LTKAVRFVDRFPVVDTGLLFHGAFGVGKTHLAVGVLKAVIRKTAAKGYFFETPELLRQVRNTYNTRVDETEMGILKPIIDADILVLDDLGTEKTSEWVQETLGLLINSRYNTRRPTILTSNLDDSVASDDPNSFDAQIGARTRSRLLEMCEWVRIQSADIRDPGRAAAAAEAGQWPTPPDNIKKGALPGKTRGQVRAQLKDKGAADLKWTGGKAGT